jgi:uroporphyrinogen-III synthase
VITRPKSQDEKLAVALIRVGAFPVCLPLNRIEPVDFDPGPADLGSYDQIVFTSANAVTCFVRRPGDGILAQLQRHRGIAAIGPATASKLAAFGAATSITASKHIAESMVTTLGNVAGKRILWPRAEIVRPVLAQGLRAGGATVTEIVVYRTVVSIPAGAPRAIAGADAVTFTSPSGVRAWHSALGTPAMRVVCVGPVTARAATDSGFHVDAVADPYTIDGLMIALDRAFEPSALPLS